MRCAVSRCRSGPDTDIVLAPATARWKNVWPVARPTARRASGRRPTAANRWCSRGSGEWITALAFSPDSRRPGVGSGDLVIRIWTLEVDGAISEHVLQGHGHKSSGVAISPDGKRLASGSDNGCVYLWDVGDGDAAAAPRVLKGHESWLTSLAFSPDGKRLVTGRATRRYASGICRKLSPPRRSCSGPQRCGLYSVAFGPDGAQVVSGSGDKTARIWSADGRGARASSADIAAW